MVEGQLPGPHLHDDEDDTAEVDGGLEGGHGLAVSQTVQGALVHFQQQVSFLGSENFPFLFLEILPNLFLLYKIGKVG